MAEKNITWLDFFISRAVPITDLFVIGKAVKNWPDLLLFRYNLKKQITVIFRTKGSLTIKNKEEYFYFLHGTKDWSVELARQEYPKIRIGKNVVKIRAFGKDNFLYFKSKTELGTATGLGVEEFVWNEYKWLDVKGRDVLDIGACVGDTALYFARKGARHIYAVEPFGRSYEIAEKNISLNKLNDKVTLINAGVVDKTGATRVREDLEVGNMISLDNIIARTGRKIKLTTLKSLVNKYRIKDGALKIDCEGGEYKILLSSSREVLRSFKCIQLEYHHGYIDLKKKLENAGFGVKHTLPRYSGYDDVVNNIFYSGLLFATRID